MKLHAPGTSDVVSSCGSETAAAVATLLSPLALDHIGIAVRSIVASSSFYKALGMNVTAIETVCSEGVQTAMLSVGESRIELLEPLAADTVVGRFLDRRGEGLHHIAIRVRDIQMCRDNLAGCGVRLVGDTIGSGSGGSSYFFVHPSSAGGVLVEIVGDAPARTAAEGRVHDQIEGSANKDTV